MKPKWLSRRISKPGPYLMLCLSMDEYSAALKHLRVVTDHQWLNSGADAACHHLATGIGSAAIVCLSAADDRDPIEICGLLVHEAVHVWQEYAALMGEQHPGDEQEAYAVQSIAQDLMAEYARRVVEDQRCYGGRESAKTHSQECPAVERSTPNIQICKGGIT